MKIAVGILALLFAKPAAKIWAGDCVAGAELRGAAPVAQAPPQSLPEAAAGAIPPGEKQ
jgi:hypothetical protein